MPNYISQIDFGDGVIRKFKGQGGGSALRIGDVTNFAASSEPNVQKITLKWNDPDDLVIEGATQLSWEGTLIVRKAGSMPISNGDGVVVVDNTVRNQYSTNGFEDTDIEFDTTYYYRAFPYSSNGKITEGSCVFNEVTEIKIFGVEWDGTASSSWTRIDAATNFTDPIPAVNNGTGSSPFDNIMPWKGMQRVEDSEAGSLVSIPKYWYKWTRTGSAMKLQISSTPQEGFLVSPAHADRGDGKGERDIVYVGRYHCGSNYKSVNGQQPLGDVNRASFRAAIHNLGSTIWQYDYAMYWTIMMLYLVEYANWDSQTVIGYGCTTINYSPMTMGYTDSMQYHTGTTVANRTTYGGTQYRYIEGLWDNVRDWCDGIYFAGTRKRNVYCIKNPANFSDTKGGTLVGSRANNYGIISGWTNPTASGFEYALYPETINTADSGSSYVCDGCNYGTSGVVLCVGGNYNQSNASGAFYLGGDGGAGSLGAYIGSRLMKLPNNS